MKLQDVVMQPSVSTAAEPCGEMNQTMTRSPLNRTQYNQSKTSKSLVILATQRGVLDMLNTTQRGTYSGRAGSAPLVSQKQLHSDVRTLHSGFPNRRGEVAQQTG